MKSQNQTPTPFQRLLSLCILISFITTNFFVLPTQTAQAADPSDVKMHPKDFSAIRIPEEMGRIEEIYWPDPALPRSANREPRKGRPLRGTRHAARGSPAVILIQDAHAIPDAQRNIQKLIEYFQRQYGVGLVALEGASSNLDPQIFRSFPDKKILQQVFEDYYERGELTGSVAAAIFSASGGNETLFHGIESWPLYEEGLGHYLSAMKNEPLLLEKLQAAGRRLQVEKEKIYSKGLLEIDKALEGFRQNHSDLIPILKRLGKVKRPEKGTELAILLSATNSSDGSASGGEESEAETSDQAPLEREVREIAEEVRKYLVSEAAYRAPRAANKVPMKMPGLFAERGARVAVRRLNEFNAKYQAFQTSRMSAAEFALYLKGIVDRRAGLSGAASRAPRTANPRRRSALRAKGGGLDAARGFTDRGSLPVTGGIHFSGRLSRLIEHQKRMRDIFATKKANPSSGGEGTRFFREFETYVQSVKENFFRTEEERALDRESRQLYSMEKLAKLELSREEWEDFKKAAAIKGYVFFGARSSSPLSRLRRQQGEGRRLRYSQTARSRFQDLGSSQQPFSGGSPGQMVVATANNITMSMPTAILPKTGSIEDQMETHDAPKRISEKRNNDLEMASRLYGAFMDENIKGGLPDVKLKNNIIYELISMASYHCRFYENAEAREAAMFGNLMKMMNGSDPRSLPRRQAGANRVPRERQESTDAGLIFRGTRHAGRGSPSASILVAGGFHTDGLTQRLKEENISYVLVMPQIGSIPEDNHYRDHMRGEVSWKDYFRVENGKVNLYKAFVRATRDRLLQVEGRRWRVEGKAKAQGSSFDLRPSTFHLAKRWRDQIIRDLAAKNQIMKVGDYTPFLDEVSDAADGDARNDFHTQWRANIKRFLQNLHDLETRHELTEQNVLKLFKPAAHAGLIGAPDILEPGKMEPAGLLPAALSIPPPALVRPSVRAEVRVGKLEDGSLKFEDKEKGKTHAGTILLPTSNFERPTFPPRSEVRTLTLERRVDEEIVIGGRVRVKLSAIKTREKGGREVRIAIQAPPEIKILRVGLEGTSEFENKQINKEGGDGWLVLTRKEGERILMYKEELSPWRVTLTVKGIGSTKAWFVIEAPREIEIMRDELLRVGESEAVKNSREARPVYVQGEEEFVKHLLGQGKTLRFQIPSELARALFEFETDHGILLQDDQIETLIQAALTPRQGEVITLTLPARSTTALGTEQVIQEKVSLVLEEVGQQRKRVETSSSGRSEVRVDRGAFKRSVTITLKELFSKFRAKRLALQKPGVNFLPKDFYLQLWSSDGTAAIMEEKTNTAFLVMRPSEKGPFAVAMTEPSVRINSIKIRFDGEADVRDQSSMPQRIAEFLDSFFYLWSESGHDIHYSDPLVVEHKFQKPVAPQAGRMNTRGIREWTLHEFTLSTRSEMRTKNQEEGQGQKVEEEHSGEAEAEEGEENGQKETDVELIRKVQQGDASDGVSAMEKLLGRYHGLIVRYAKKYNWFLNPGLSMSFEDLLQASEDGFMTAVMKFPLESEIRFTTFITRHIKNAVYGAFALHRTIHIPQSYFKHTWLLPLYEQVVEALEREEKEQPITVQENKPVTLQKIKEEMDRRLRKDPDEERRRKRLAFLAKLNFKRVKAAYYAAHARATPSAINGSGPQELVGPSMSLQQKEWLEGMRSVLTSHEFEIIQHRLTTPPPELQNSQAGEERAKENQELARRLGISSEKIETLEQSAKQKIWRHVRHLLRSGALDARDFQSQKFREFFLPQLLTAQAEVASWGRDPNRDPKTGGLQIPAIEGKGIRIKDKTLPLLEFFKTLPKKERNQYRKLLTDSQRNIFNRILETPKLELRDFADGRQVSSEGARQQLLRIIGLAILLAQAREEGETSFPAFLWKTLRRGGISTPALVRLLTAKKIHTPEAFLKLTDADLRIAMGQPTYGMYGDRLLRFLTRERSRLQAPNRISAAPNSRSEARSEAETLVQQADGYAYRLNRESTLRSVLAEILILAERRAADPLEESSLFAEVKIGDSDSIPGHRGDVILPRSTVVRVKPLLEDIRRSLLNDHAAELAASVQTFILRSREGKAYLGLLRGLREILEDETLDSGRKELLVKALKQATKGESEEEKRKGIFLDHYRVELPNDKVWQARLLIIPTTEPLTDGTVATLRGLSVKESPSSERPTSGEEAIDLGAGQGTISIFLAQSNIARVFALDLNEELLDLVPINALLNGVDKDGIPLAEKIIFLHSNMFQPLWHDSYDASQKEAYQIISHSPAVDLIVSNPPQRPHPALLPDWDAHKADRDPNAFLFRYFLQGPRDDKGLEFSRALLVQAKQRLRPSGRLYLQMVDWNPIEDRVGKLFEEYGFNHATVDQSIQRVRYAPTSDFPFQLFANHESESSEALHYRFWDAEETKLTAGEALKLHESGKDIFTKFMLIEGTLKQAARSEVRGVKLGDIIASIQRKTERARQAIVDSELEFYRRELQNASQTLSNILAAVDRRIERREAKEARGIIDKVSREVPLMIQSFHIERIERLSERLKRDLTPDQKTILNMSRIMQRMKRYPHKAERLTENLYQRMAAYVSRKAAAVSPEDLQVVNDALDRIARRKGMTVEQFKETAFQEAYNAFELLALIHSTTYKYVPGGYKETASSLGKLERRIGELAQRRRSEVRNVLEDRDIAGLKYFLNETYLSDWSISEIKAHAPQMIQALINLHQSSQSSNNEKIAIDGLVKKLKRLSVTKAVEEGISGSLIEETKTVAREKEPSWWAKLRKSVIYIAALGVITFFLDGVYDIVTREGSPEAQMVEDMWEEGRQLFPSHSISFKKPHTIPLVPPERHAIILYPDGKFRAIIIFVPLEARPMAYSMNPDQYDYFLKKIQTYLENKESQGKPEYENVRRSYDAIFGADGTKREERKKEVRRQYEEGKARSEVRSVRSAAVKIFKNPSRVVTLLAEVALVGILFYSINSLFLRLDPSKLPSEAPQRSEVRAIKSEKDFTELEKKAIELILQEWRGVTPDVREEEPEQFLTAALGERAPPESREELIRYFGTGRYRLDFDLKDPFGIQIRNAESLEPIEQYFKGFENFQQLYPRYGRADDFTNRFFRARRYLEAPQTLPPDFHFGRVFLALLDRATVEKETFDRDEHTVTYGPGGVANVYQKWQIERAKTGDKADEIDTAYLQRLEEEYRQAERSFQEALKRLVSQKKFLFLEMLALKMEQTLKEFSKSPYLSDWQLWFESMNESQRLIRGAAWTTSRSEVRAEIIKATIEDEKEFRSEKEGKGYYKIFHLSGGNQKWSGIKLSLVYWVSNGGDQTHQFLHWIDELRREEFLLIADPRVSFEAIIDHHQLLEDYFVQSKDKGFKRILRTEFLGKVEGELQRQSLLRLHMTTVHEAPFFSSQAMPTDKEEEMLQPLSDPSMGRLAIERYLKMPLAAPPQTLREVKKNLEEFDGLMRKLSPPRRYANELLPLYNDTRKVIIDALRQEAVRFEQLIALRTKLGKYIRAANRITATHTVSYAKKGLVKNFKRSADLLSTDYHRTLIGLAPRSLKMNLALRATLPQPKIFIVLGLVDEQRQFYSATQDSSLFRSESSPAQTFKLERAETILEMLPSNWQILVLPQDIPIERASPENVQALKTPSGIEWHARDLSFFRDRLGFELQLMTKDQKEAIVDAVMIAGHQYEIWQNPSHARKLFPANANKKLTDSDIRKTAQRQYEEFNALVRQAVITFEIDLRVADLQAIYEEFVQRMASLGSEEELKEKFGTFGLGQLNEYKTLMNAALLRLQSRSEARSEVVVRTGVLLKDLPGAMSSLFNPGESEIAVQVVLQYQRGLPLKGFYDGKEMMHFQLILPTDTDMGLSIGQEFVRYIQLRNPGIPSTASFEIIFSFFRKGASLRVNAERKEVEINDLKRKLQSELGTIPPIFKPNAEGILPEPYEDSPPQSGVWRGLRSEVRRSRPQAAGFGSQVTNIERQNSSKPEVGSRERAAVSPRSEARVESEMPDRRTLDGEEQLRETLVQLLERIQVLERIQESKKSQGSRQVILSYQIEEISESNQSEGISKSKRISGSKRLDLPKGDLSAEAIVQKLKELNGWDPKASYAVVLFPKKRTIEISIRKWPTSQKPSVSGTGTPLEVTSRKSQVTNIERQNSSEPEAGSWQPAAVSPRSEVRAGEFEDGSSRLEGRLPTSHFKLPTGGAAAPRSEARGEVSKSFENKVGKLLQIYPFFENSFKATELSLLIKDGVPGEQTPTDVVEAIKARKLRARYVLLELWIKREAGNVNDDIEGVNYIYQEIQAILGDDLQGHPYLMPERFRSEVRMGVNFKNLRVDFRTEVEDFLALIVSEISRSKIPESFTKKELGKILKENKIKASANLVIRRLIKYDLLARRWLSPLSTQYYLTDLGKQIAQEAASAHPSERLKVVSKPANPGANIRTWVFEVLKERMDKNEVFEGVARLTRINPTAVLLFQRQLSIDILRPIQKATLAGRLRERRFDVTKNGNSLLIQEWIRDQEHPWRLDTRYVNSFSFQKGDRITVTFRRRSELRAIKNVAIALAPGVSKEVIDRLINPSVVDSLVVQYQADQEGFQQKLFARMDILEYHAAREVMQMFDGHAGKKKRPVAIGTALPKKVDREVTHSFFKGALEGLHKAEVSEFLKSHGRLPQAFESGLSKLGIPLHHIDPNRPNVLHGDGQAKVPLALLGKQKKGGKNIDWMFAPLFIDQIGELKNNPDASHWLGQLTIRVLVNMAHLSEDERLKTNPERLRSELRKRLNLEGYEDLISIHRNGTEWGLGINAVLAQQTFFELLRRQIESAA